MMVKYLHIAYLTYCLGAWVTCLLSLVTAQCECTYCSGKAVWCIFQVSKPTWVLKRALLLHRKCDSHGQQAHKHTSWSALFFQSPCIERALFSRGLDHEVMLRNKFRKSEHPGFDYCNTLQEKVIFLCFYFLFFGNHFWLSPLARMQVFFFDKWQLTLIKGWIIIRIFTKVCLPTQWYYTMISTLCNFQFTFPCPVTP